MWNTHDSVKEKLTRQYQEDHYENGLELEELKDHVQTLFWENNALTPMAQKAKAIAYVLRNAQIEINPDEFFADKLNYGTILWDHLRQQASEVEQLVFPHFSQIIANCTKVGAFSAGMDFGHIAPDWKFVLEKGIPGILDRLQAYRVRYRDDGKKRAFYDNSICVYEAFRDLLIRMADQAEGIGTEKMRFVGANLRQLAVSAPQTLAQAMQLTLLYYPLQMDLDCPIVGSLGGLDRLYGELYQNDIASGRFTDSQLRELTRDFLWKISARDVTANTPFYICGKDAAGKDATNDYTMVLLEEYDRLDIYNPKMHVMYHPQIRQDVLDKILHMIRNGHSSFVFINVASATRALENIGIDPEDAKRVIVYGCYEAAAEGTEVPSTVGSMLNLSKAVELALFNGRDPGTGIAFGPETGETFATFDAFKEAVKAQIRFMAESSAAVISAYEPHYDVVCPSPMISATFANCVETGVDMYSGGAKYNNTSIVGAGIATLADSVMAVKKIVFEQRLVTLQELKSCLQSNWAANLSLRDQCLNLPEKFGNNHAQTDALAVELFECFADTVNNRKNGRGGVFRCGLFSVDARMWLGEATGATPDGRRQGEPLSKNIAASVGQDKKGVTALLGSMLKFDSGKMPDGAVSDIVLHSSAVKGEDGFMALKGLLLAFMRAGGYSIHFNVLNQEILKKAQAEPEKYKNLQIRLCGWNVHFVNLSKQEQDEFILQAARGY